MTQLKISEAAKRIGVHPNTLRDLENRGMITVRRDWNGRRIFTEDEITGIYRRLFYKESEQK